MHATYVLNPDTGKIHIIGYCRLTNPHPKEWLPFETEEAARSYYGGQSAGLCKLCLQKREKNLRKENHKA